MYFINKKIVKSIANEIYRNAGFTLDDVEGWYCVYDSENQFRDYERTVTFAVCRDMNDEVFEYKHFTICVEDNDNGKKSYYYYTTNTLNRRELADKLLEIIEGYELNIMLQEVS